MVPENIQAIVKKALRAAFSVDQYDDIQQLTKGLSSALTFKIGVRGNPYLLKVITRTDAMGDPEYYFARMLMAAENKLAPHIHYLNAEDRISITDFIIEQDFSITQAKEMMPSLLRKLHSLPKFPHRIDYFEKMEGFIAKFRETNSLREDEIKDFLELYKRIASVYPRNDAENLVSCHNDVKPENVIFDGERPWLVDWESAFLNDRYLDLSMVANFVVKNDKDEFDFLRTYSAERLDEYQHARLFLMRQLLHVHYFAFLMLIHPGEKPINLATIRKYGFSEFHDGLWNGEISLVESDRRLEYAVVHMEQVRRNMESMRLEESLRTVARKSKSG